MNALRKVLVVDSGHRAETDLLSTELAELGLASVTTSLEAAEAVLEVIDRPSAIFLNMPSRSDCLDGLRELAAALRRSDRAVGVPVIEWDREAALQAGGVSAILRAEIGPQALAGPDL
jgi:uncharacterized protein (DUF58 family)